MKRHYTYRLIIAFTTLSALSPAIAQTTTEEADSVPTTQLDDLVVDADYARMKGFTIEYIPTKSERKHSNSPGSLIDRMHLPTLKVEGENIFNGANQQVTIFVNGEKLSAAELSTFWPMEVKKVEYIEKSSDPRYINSLPAVNFVMDYYKYGGVTKINARQTLLETGYYNVASKLTTGKFTTSALVNYNFFNSDFLNSETKSSYKDLFLDGQKYDLILKNSRSSSDIFNQYYGAAINLKYSSDKYILNHTVSLSGQKDPRSNSEYDLEWNINGLTNDKSSSTSNLNKIMPAVSAFYYFQLNNRSTLNAGWSYSHAINKANSGYSNTNGLEFFNNTREEGDNAKASASYAYILGRGLQIGTGANFSYQNFRTNYEGTANEKVVTWITDADLNLNLQWMINRYLSIDITPQISNYSYRSGNADKQSIWIPSGKGSIFLSNCKNMMGGATVSYQKYSPTASSLADIIVRNDEITWTRGNPYIKPTELWSVDLNLMWIPNRFLNVSSRVYNSIYKNHTAEKYELNPDQNEGGLIATTINYPQLYMFSWDARMQLRYKMLTLFATPVYTFTQTSGEYKRSLNNLRIITGLNITLGDFCISGAYQSSYKMLSDGGQSTSKQPERWNIGASYGNGNLQVALNLYDLTTKSLKSISEFSSIHYDSYRISCQRGRRVELQLTYTFGYGKRVDSMIDAQAPSSIESGVVQTK